MTVHEILQQLKQMGCKITPQRRLLIEVLTGAPDTEMTAEEIHQQVRSSFPDVGLDTVYRNLRLLSKLNVVDELKLPGKILQYSINQHIHQHKLVCLNCGVAVAMKHCPIKELKVLAKEENGFTITSHRIELFGYCPQCLD